MMCAGVCAFASTTDAAVRPHWHLRSVGFHRTVRAPSESRARLEQHARSICICYVTFSHTDTRTVHHMLNFIRGAPPHLNCVDAPTAKSRMEGWIQVEFPT